MQVFYAPNIDDITYHLTEEESKHAIKVLRLKLGDEVCLVDGKGGLYYGIIDEADPKNTVARIIEKIEQYGRRNYKLHIAIAPTKNIERLEWFLEKCTEIGIDEITPLLCQRSERKQIKPERLQKIILSAVKQSIKAYVPKLNELTPFTSFINQEHDGDLFIAHCENSPKPSLKSKIQDQKSITILIGPEGDFSPEEIKMAIDSSAKEVHLGKSRLRTETAGVVACHSVNFTKED